MTVYLIGQISIHNREQYNKYDAAFMDVFNQFDGTILSVDEKPMKLEGEWSATRTVLLSFPSAEKAQAWFSSAEYQAIVGDRLAASNTNSVMIMGMENGQINRG